VLAEKPELVVFSKVDLVPEEERAKRIRRLATEIGLGKDEPPVVISGATGEGVRQLLERAYAMVKGEAMPTEWRR
jgi:50S ribosomal subunit-associated GTPase HflX